MLAKKYIIKILTICAFAAIIGAPFFISAQEQEKTVIYFFESKTCPHCAAEKIFLENLEKENSQIEVKSFEITEHPENAELIKKIGEMFGIDASHIPLTIIGRKYFIGYDNDSTTGELIKKLVKEREETNGEDIIAKIISGNGITEVPQNPSASQQITDKITLPFIGETEIKNLSLPVLTLIIAALDGFNPCAMWVLALLISFLLGMKNRRRMWALGTVFIATSGIFYFLFLAAWLNLFLVIGFIFWVRLAIGLVAGTSGIFYLKKYFKKQKNVCAISESDKRQKITDKLKKTIREEKFFFALTGIIALAIMVNTVELVCSAGLPAIYTHVLSLSNLPATTYYSYLIFYIIIFMLDDMIMFTAAMLALKRFKLADKYNHMSLLIGGLVMLALAVLLIFKPELLSFNIQ